MSCYQGVRKGLINALIRPLWGVAEALGVHPGLKSLYTLRNLFVQSLPSHHDNIKKWDCFVGEIMGIFQLAGKIRKLLGAQAHLGALSGCFMP